MAKVDVEPDIEAQQELVSAPDVPLEIIGRSPSQLFWRRFRKDKFAIAGLVGLGIVVILAIGAPVIADIVGHAVDEEFIFEMTSDTGVPLGPDLNNEAGAFYFGAADRVGHDLLVWIMYGIRTSLIVALSATVIEVVLGVLFGILAGFYRGKIDTVISRATDVFYALPTLLLILGLVSACTLTSEGGCFGGLLKPGTTLVAAVIGIFGWPYIARIIRGQVLSIREKEFVESARSLGAGNWRIMFREILPNVVAPIIVYATLIIPTNVLIEAALSFLGIGVPPDVPSLGALLDKASVFYRFNPWAMVFPGIFLLLVTLCFNLVGDGLRDAFDPKTA